MPVSQGVYIYTIKTGNFTDKKNDFCKVASPKIGKS